MHILFCVNNIKFGTKCFVKVEQFVLPFIFVGGARIDHIIAAQEKAKQKAYLNQLLTKRKEIETNLFLIQDYIHKAIQ